METQPLYASPREGLRGLFASGSFLRLWTIGGVVNAMRWVELLAAGLFTLEVTGSGLAVAAISAARTLPMFLFGAIAGAVCESIDRKRILFTGLLVSATSAGCIFSLAELGVLRPWHIAIAAFISGCVWATEMATRRRMVGESAGPALISRAVAMDSLTGACTRGIGPIIGSVAFAHLGIQGAFGISMLSYALTLALVPGIRHAQATRPLALRRLPADLAEGFAIARRQPAVLAVLGVTMTMNLFAFSYSAVVAPIARIVFDMPPAYAGILAGGEPLGSLLGGLILASVTPRASPRVMMLSGSASFLVALAIMPFIPNYWLACTVLTIGGLGLALFGNMQTTLVLTLVPQAMRSRVMGLITVSIGTGPLGQVLIGAFSEGLGPLGAVLVTAFSGLVVLAIVAILWTVAERRAKPAEPEETGS